MAGTIFLESLLILGLILLNGLFAMSEVALLSARRARLEQLASEGRAGARAALALIAEPNRFLSTVQVGITLIGVLAGAFSGATVGRLLADALREWPRLAPYADVIGIGLVVIVITYLSLVIGELVPKRLAISRAEAIACAAAPPLNLLSRLASPLIRLLSFSTEVVLGLLGSRQAGQQTITEEEIRLLIAEGAASGVLHQAEQDIVERVFRLDDVRISTLMTPHTEIVWLDALDPFEETCRLIRESGFSVFPVGEGSLDRTLGVVSVKHLWGCQPVEHAVDLRQVVRPPLFIPQNAPALRALSLIRESGAHTALVIDEHGGIDGLVTLNDILEAIVGDLPEYGSGDTPEIVQRADGSWLVDAQIAVGRLAEEFDLTDLPPEEARGYETLGGLVMAELGRIPQETDSFVLGGLHFEVIDMDGRRVDKVLISPAVSSEDEDQTLPAT